MTKEITKFNSIDDLKFALAKDYQKQIENYFKNEQLALKFLSSVVSSVQRTPELLECEPLTVINAFMGAAQLGLMPSDVSGEAYILPYKNNSKGIKEAKLQIGYQGFATLFYRAGAKRVFADIIRQNDTFSYKTGIVVHEPDVFSKNRGEAIGAYAAIEVANGGTIYKAMTKDEIMAIAKRYSKSYGTKFSPWQEGNDLELWMWKKTVVKQLAKLAPKNDELNTAIAKDNEDSAINKQLEKGKVEAEKLKMGNLLKENDKDKTDKKETSKDKSEPKQDTDSS